MRTTPVTNLLIGWDIALVLYLALTSNMFAHCNIAHIRREAALQDESSLIILILVIITAALSLAAIIVSLDSGPSDPASAPSRESPT